MHSLLLIILNLKNMKVKYLIIVFLFNSCLSLKFGNKEVKNSTFENRETIEFINSQENIDRGYPFSEATIVNGIILSLIHISEPTRR